MFCGYCGKQNSDEYRFCSKCGELIELTGEAPTYSEDAGPVSDDNSSFEGGHEEVSLSKEGNDDSSEKENDADGEDSIESLSSQQQETFKSSSTSTSKLASNTKKHNNTGMAILVGAGIVGIVIILFGQYVEEKRTPILPSNKQVAQKRMQNDKQFAGASLENSKIKKPIHEYKSPKRTFIEDISIAAALKAGEKQRCGSHVLHFKEIKGEDGIKFEHIEIMTDRGTFVDSIEGYRISEVACLDLTGDGKINLFLQYWGGGNSPSDYGSEVYTLEEPIQLIHEQAFNYVAHFVDLNNDGIQEIQSYYSFRYIGGLCGACSPPRIEKYHCYQSGKYKECSNQFPSYYNEVISLAKEIISEELNKLPNIESLSDQSELNKLKAFSVLVLVSAILLDKEDQESQYLRKTLPDKVYTWLIEADNRDYIDEVLNLDNSSTQKS
jgi:hypothetical protein